MSLPTDADLAKIVNDAFEQHGTRLAENRALFVAGRQFEREHPEDPRLGAVIVEGLVARGWQRARAVKFVEDAKALLAPLLDDAAKRELVKAAGIDLEHFPECKDEGWESEVEPLL
jgi:hypothetical protein